LYHAAEFTTKYRWKKSGNHQKEPGDRPKRCQAMQISSGGLANFRNVSTATVRICLVRHRPIFLLDDYFNRFGTSRDIAEQAGRDSLL